jgi:hypothetical protein
MFGAEFLVPTPLRPRLLRFARDDTRKCPSLRGAQRRSNLAVKFDEGTICLVPNTIAGTELSHPEALGRDAGAFGQ